MLCKCRTAGVHVAGLAGWAESCLCLALWICIIFIHEAVIGLCVCSCTHPFLCTRILFSLLSSPSPSPTSRQPSLIPPLLQHSFALAAIQLSGPLLLATADRQHWPQLPRVAMKTVKTVASLFCSNGETSHCHVGAFFKDWALSFFLLLLLPWIGSPSNPLPSNHILAVGRPPLLCLSLANESERGGMCLREG